MTDTSAVIRELAEWPLEMLAHRAWAVRKANFPSILWLAAPGAKRYESDAFCNQPEDFAIISLTGRRCALKCEHCHGRLLESMYAATTPAALETLADQLIAQGCQGVLLSGGADREGGIRFDGFIHAIAGIKRRGLKVIVHTGLVDWATARALKAAGVDQALIDIIGDEATIREIYHLDKTPADYAQSLANLLEAGLPVAPHIVIGLYFGQIRGELEALRLVTEANVEKIVLVILTPLSGSSSRGWPLVSPLAAAQIIAHARIMNPCASIALGCARPAQTKVLTEQLAIRVGVNAIAYPTDDAIAFAHSRGLKTKFSPLCCSLL